VEKLVLAVGVRALLSETELNSRPTTKILSTATRIYLCILAPIFHCKTLRAGNLSDLKDSRYFVSLQRRGIDEKPDAPPRCHKDMITRLPSPYQSLISGFARAGSGSVGIRFREARRPALTRGRPGPRYSFLFFDFSTRALMSSRYLSVISGGSLVSSSIRALDTCFHVRLCVLRRSAPLRSAPLRLA
jgi:hypothetical protein